MILVPYENNHVVSQYVPHFATGCIHNVLGMSGGIIMKGLTRQPAHSQHEIKLTTYWR